MDFSLSHNGNRLVGRAPTNYKSCHDLARLKPRCALIGSGLIRFGRIQLAGHPARSAAILLGRAGVGGARHRPPSDISAAPGLIVRELKSNWIYLSLPIKLPILTL